MFPVVCEKSAPFPAVKSKIKNQKSKIRFSSNQIFRYSPPDVKKLKLKELQVLTKFQEPEKEVYEYCYLLILSSSTVCLTASSFFTGVKLKCLLNFELSK